MANFIPPGKVRVRVIIFWQNCEFSLKHLNVSLTLKNRVDLYLIMTVFEAKSSETGIIRTENSMTRFLCVCGFFLQVIFVTSLFASLPGGYIC